MCNWTLHMPVEKQHVPAPYCVENCVEKPSLNSVTKKALTLLLRDHCK